MRFFLRELLKKVKEVPKESTGRKNIAYTSFNRKFTEEVPSFYTASAMLPKAHTVRVSIYNP